MDRSLDDAPRVPLMRSWVQGTRRVAGAGLALLATVAIGTAPAGATDVVVATEAEYRQALVDLSVDATGPHTILLGADLELTDASDPTYTGTQPLTIDGAGHELISHESDLRLLFHDTSAPLVVHDLVIGGAENAEDGGAISSAATLTTLQRVDVTASSSQASGGTLHALGDVLFEQVQVVNGFALDRGGVLHVEGGGTTTLTASSFFRNTGDIGAVVATDGPLQVVNSSTWLNDGDSILDAGDAAIDLVFSTLASDRVDAFTPLGVVVTTGPLTSFGSLLGRSISGPGPTCAVGSTTASYSSEAHGSTCGFTGPAATADGQLDNPADNGGPTETLAIHAGEGYADAIPLAACEASGVLVDQRGEPRPGAFTDGCDIGAFEIQGEAPAPPTPDPAPSPTDGPIAGRPGFTG